MRSITKKLARPLVSLSLATLLAVGVAGCASAPKSDVTGSIATADTQRSEAEWRQ